MDVEGEEEEDDSDDDEEEVDELQEEEEKEETEEEEDEEEEAEEEEVEKGEAVADEDIGEPVEVGEKEEEMDAEEEEEEDGEKEEEKEDEGPGEYRVSLPWVTRKMIHEAHYENIHNPRCVLKRSYVFKWFAAVAIDLGPDLLTDIIHIVLPALHRELNNTRRMPDPKLKALTQEVLELLKKTVGTTVFSEKFAQAQKVRMERISSRKQRKAVEAVTRPDISYKRKQKQNIAKVAAKKRKVEKIRTMKVLKGKFSRKS
uniref:U3 small nucleolar RNA-associated protein 20 C-terminal domain-containing protein n=2 Tax=Octopus bimaculoides TaxID=37653 RepID=A0A0L8H0Z1_OCTBM